MKIGQLAKLTGLTPSRIRFYESSGLLQTAARQANGYRDYPAGTELILEIIDGAQRTGFSLEQIRPLLPQTDGRWNHASLLSALEAKMAEIEQSVQRLQQNKARLQLAITRLQQRPAGINCADNSSRVLHPLRQADTGRRPRKPARQR